MVSFKHTSLPHVLTQYLSEYEEEEESSSGDERSHDPKVTEVTKVRVKSMKSGHQSTPRAPSRERTQEILKRQQQRERYERQYENWQEVKAIYRDEQTRGFRKKSSLQKQLITTRDNLRQIRQREQEEEKQRLREATRAAKQAQTNHLEQICRESLDCDRQRSLQKRRDATKRRHKPDVETGSGSSDNADEFPPKDVAVAGGGSHGSRPYQVPSLRHGASDELLPRGKGHFVQRDISDLSNHSSLASGPLHAPYSHAPFSHAPSRRAPGTPLYEEDDGDLDPDDVTGDPGDGEDSPGDSPDSLPWHQQQLYRLYGKRAADEFLFPRFEDKKRAAHVAVNKAVNPRLRRKGVTAGDLWNELRNDSRMKLLKEDSNMAPELKYAFSAFVRQLLQRRRAPVKRNFYEKEDVPDLDLLMDQSRVKAAQDYRHKTELMFRASHMNEDRSRVLAFNNPPNPPEIHAQAGGCERYMPSWAGEDVQDVDSEWSYKKWLPARMETGNNEKRSLQRTTEGLKEENNESDGVFPERQERPERGQRRRLKPLAASAPAPLKLSFLTEKGARCEGQFSSRHQREEERRGRQNMGVNSGVNNSVNNGLNNGVNNSVNNGGVNSQSAMAMVGERRSDAGLSGSVRGRLSQLRRSQSEMHGAEYRASQQSQQGVAVCGWQPLSLGALIEYKHHVPTLGRGDFALGKAPVWRAETTPA